MTDWTEYNEVEIHYEDSKICNVFVNGYVADREEREKIEDLISFEDGYFVVGEDQLSRFKLPEGAEESGVLTAQISFQ